MSVRNLTQVPPSQLPDQHNVGIPRIPSIRLVSGPPSAQGPSSMERSTSIRMGESMTTNPATPWDSIPTPPVQPAPKLKSSSSRLLPKASTSSLAGPSAPTRLVPKKSKLRLLGSLGHGGKENAPRNRDFSDVLRRVNAGDGSQGSLGGGNASSAKLKGGFEIYVDPNVDPDMEDVVLVKKGVKARGGLDSMGWGPTTASGTRGVLGEVNTNSGGTIGRKDSGLLKGKDDEKKWWSIGRGRKESKDEKKAKESEKERSRSRGRASSPLPPRSQTPDPFKPTKTQGEQRTRFNSLDASILLGLSSRKSANGLSSAAQDEEPAAPSPPPTIRTKVLSNPYVFPQTQARRMERIPTPPQMTYSRSATPTFGSLLGSSSNQNGATIVPNANASNQGSIALRAMRSVKSFARIGSRGAKEDGSKSEKEGKEKERKDKKGWKENKENGNTEDDKKKVKPKKSATGTLKLKKSSLRKGSTSSFEAGYLDSSPPPPMPKPHPESISRKHSILGLGLPSSMRLPNKRQGSTASSVLVGDEVAPVRKNSGFFGTVGSTFSGFSSSSKDAPTAPTSNANDTITAKRLSIDSGVHREPITGRRGSVQSTSSSLRPTSVTSTISGGSTGSSRPSSGRLSSGSSVRWDEEGLERAKAEIKLQKKSSMSRNGRGTGRESATNGRNPRESRRTLEARKRTAITDIFPEIAQGADAVAKRSVSPEPEARRYPIVTIEAATADGHGDDLDALIEEDGESEAEAEANCSMATVKPQSTVATPIKKPRVRPLSEQLLGKPRPAPMHVGEDGVLSVLSAATHDLAQLINTLDLEATPGTPDLTPLKPRSSPFSSEPSMSVTRSMSLPYNGSPKKKTLAASPVPKGIPVQASISSLRPYAQSRAGTVNSGHPTLRGKPSIPSWPVPEKSLAELRANLKPVSPKTSPVSESSPIAAAPALLNVNKDKKLPALPLPSPPPRSFVRAHKRTMTLPSMEPDPAPVFQPLRPPPSKVRQHSSPAFLKAKSTPERVRDTFDGSDEDEDRYRTLRAPKTSKDHSKGPSEGTFGSVTTTAKGKGSVQSSRGSKRSSKSSSGSSRVEENKVPMSREARKLLRMSGTMGGSDMSAYQVSLHESDPDSDVPEELRHIFRKDSPDSIDYQGPCDSRLEHREGDDSEDYRDDSSFTGRLNFLDSADESMDVEVPRNGLSVPSFLAPPSLPLAMSSQATIRGMPRAEIQQAQRLPVFRAQLITDTEAMNLDVDFDDDSLTSDENHTKKSFDFTAELAKLNETGASDRRSFVEQLETAFKTPAQVNLRADFGVMLDVPPVPPLPDFMSKVFDSSVSDESSEMRYQEEESESSVGIGRDATPTEDYMPAFLLKDSPHSAAKSIEAIDDDDAPAPFDPSMSMSLEVQQPSLEHPTHKKCMSSPVSTKANSSRARSFTTSSVMSNKSHRSGRSVELGELNRSFKFGGSSASLLVPPIPSKVAESNEFLDSLFDDLEMEVSDEEDNQVDDNKPMTLSDIIPPPSRVREVSFCSSMLDEYEDSALKSLIDEAAKGAAIPQVLEPPQHSIPSNGNMFQRERTMSGASMNTRNSRRLSSFIPLSRPTSGISFTGLDSYDEVRRGFEFNDQRPGFYPGSSTNYIGATRSRAHRRTAQDSVFSIASISSYGRVLREGSHDPFDYGTGPPMANISEGSYESEDQRYSTSFDMSTQVEDTFSFMHNRPLPRRRVDSDASSLFGRPSAPTARGHRRRSANMSVASMGGLPPVSMFNRNFGHGHHRRNSSVTSANSFALSYAHGGVGGRAIMARHRRDSLESMNSEFSPMARPGLGDKMFENDYAGRLDAIAGSPSQSISGADYESSMYGHHRMSVMSFDHYDSIIDLDDAHVYRFNRQRDSIMEEEYEDDEEMPSSMSDSLFDRTGANNRFSVGSLFGSRYSRHPKNVWMRSARPISEVSIIGPNDPTRDDDTMISMFGGGHVRRQSVGSMIVASPCVRMEKIPAHRHTARTVMQDKLRKEQQQRREQEQREEQQMRERQQEEEQRRKEQEQREEQQMRERQQKEEQQQREEQQRREQQQREEQQQKEEQQQREEQRRKERQEKEKPKVVVTPTEKTRPIELKPSIAPTSSFQFGGERMINAKRGHLDRQSLEESALTAAGEDRSVSFQAAPVFTRPPPVNRNRSRTCSTTASESSGRDTPPLSPSSGSVSGASFSSIDMPELHSSLTNTSQPVSTIASARARTREHGHGHRRRYSKIQVSRASVYETIEEEYSSDSSPAPSILEATTTKKLFAEMSDSSGVYVVGSDTESILNPNEPTTWDDERGLVALRKFYHLKDEAQTTVVESQRTWSDTPFSIYAVQAFEPPRHAEGMKALLEQSRRAFGPLPAELRRIRSRKNSRPSPYPPTRFMDTFEVPAQPIAPCAIPVFTKPNAKAAPVLQEKPRNVMGSVAPALNVLKPKPFTIAADPSSKKGSTLKDNAFPAKASTGTVRPRVQSSARKSALGSAKNKKENSVCESSIAMTPSESLRLNRPRPCAGRTPASQARAIRI